MLKKDKIIINPDDDKFTKKEKEMKLKAQRIRRNAKNKGDENLFHVILIKWSIARLSVKAIYLFSMTYKFSLYIFYTDVP